jgi:cell division transport system ATP-binding protein
VIESYHLSKLYKRGVYALRDVTLTIDKGEFVLLTGPSGAGKSTFLRLLLREELPSQGDLKVLGRDLKTLRPAQAQTSQRSVGFVFQDFRLIPRFTVFENVAFVMRVLALRVRTQHAQDVPGVEVGRLAASHSRFSRGAVERRAAADRHGAGGSSTIRS